MDAYSVGLVGVSGTLESLQYPLPSGPTGLLFKLRRVESEPVVAAVQGLNRVPSGLPLLSSFNN